MKCVFSLFDNRYHLLYCVRATGNEVKDFYFLRQVCNTGGSSFIILSPSCTKLHFARLTCLTEITYGGCTETLGPFSFPGPQMLLFLIRAAGISH